MLRTRPPAVPLDYSLCNQTVTVYHMDRATKTVYRWVIEGAHFEWRRDNKLGKTGNTETNSFLLVIPQSSRRWVPPAQLAGAPDAYTLENQDKVFLGVGPEVAPPPQDWVGLIPAKVHGLVVVNQVAPKYWRGAVCHLEAS
ncbi:hypothetical protein LJC64_02300 [Ruminococcaceae bacterium OttesenSCG-928-A11]|nr:hypothetical protein [Ruminococcaceae bacterium OttesenSCG-928-A11]